MNLSSYKNFSIFYTFIFLIFIIPNHSFPNKLNIIKDDFLINDDTTGTATQKSPYVSTNNHNESIICWEDWRSGFGEMFIQRFDSLGMEIDTNIVILPKLYSIPKAILFNNNEFALYCNQNNKLYYQFFDLNNSSTSNLLGISDTTNGNQYRLQLACDNNENFAAVWEDTRLGNNNIYLQMWDSTRTKINNNIRVDVNSDSTNYSSYPCIAYFSNGDFIVVWLSDLELKYQLFNKNGNLISNNQTIITNQILIHSASAVTINELDQWMVVYTAGNYDLYAQCLDKNGTNASPEFKVNTISNDHYEPEIIALTQTDFLICWEYMGSRWGDIYCQQVTSLGNLIGSNIKVNNDTGTAEQSALSISNKMINFCTMTWYDNRNGTKDIYLQRIDTSSNLIGSNQKVNDDIGAGVQQNPSISMNNIGEIVIVWQDVRNGQTAPDIFVQKINQNGQFIGSNLKINDDSLASFPQIFPEVSIDSTGEFNCVWKDSRNYGNNIYGQWFDSQSNRLGNNILVSDLTTWTVNYYPRVDMNVYGQSVVTWFTMGGGYYRIFDNLGQPISNQLSTFSGFYPDVGICGDGRFAITWMDNSDIFMQQYSSNGDTLGGEIRLVDEVNTASQYAPRNAMNSNGDAVAAWIDERNGYQEVWAQLYHINGTIIGNNFRVNDQNINGIPYTPKVSINENGESIIVWSNALQDNQWVINGQKIDSLGNLIGTNILLIDTVGNNYLNRPYVACNNQQIAITWMDNRRNKGFDIYAKIFTWDWEGIINSSQIINTFPSDFKLENNYPNPFNSQTTINFELSKPSVVSLIIYDVLGKKIRTLISGNMKSAKNSVNWTGRNDAGEVVSSGVYFYRLETPKNGQSKTKKMLLIK